MLDSSYAERQQQIVARMTEALVDARTQIQVDRQAHFDCAIGPTGLDPADKAIADEYDRVLVQISVALDHAKGQRE